MLVTRGCTFVDWLEQYSKSMFRCCFTSKNPEGGTLAVAVAELRLTIVSRVLTGRGKIFGFPALLNSKVLKSQSRNSVSTVAFDVSG